MRRNQLLFVAIVFLWGVGVATVADAQTMDFAPRDTKLLSVLKAHSATVARLEIQAKGRAAPGLCAAGLTTILKVLAPTPLADALTTPRFGRRANALQELRLIGMHQAFLKPIIAHLEGKTVSDDEIRRWAAGTFVVYNASALMLPQNFLHLFVEFLSDLFSDDTSRNTLHRYFDHIERLVTTESAFYATEDFQRYGTGIGIVVNAFFEAHRDSEILRAAFSGGASPGNTSGLSFERATGPNTAGNRLQPSSAP